MARRSHDQIVKEYAKEYDRIRKQIERMEKRGYDVRGLKPARVSKKEIKAKDLEKLKRITNEKIYEKSKFAGESGAKRRKEERSERSRKSAETKRRRKTEEWIKEVEKANRQPEAPKPPRVPKPPKPVPEEPEEEDEEPEPDKELTDEQRAAEERFYEEINRFNSKFRDKMNEWYRRVILEAGRNAATSMLSDFYEDGNEITYKDAYSDTARNVLQYTITEYLDKDSVDNNTMDSLSDEFMEVSEDIDDELGFW